MTYLDCRRERLVHVLDLARMYRGWTRQEVAAALGREPSKMVPESGNPKLDLVVGIARLLEWPVGEVAECLWGSASLDGPIDEPERPRDPQGDSLRESPRAGALMETAALCRVHGRFRQEVECLQSALLEPSLPRRITAAVQSRLADAHYTLWHLAEARALASELLRSFHRVAPGNFEERFAHASALCVRGHAHRRQVSTDPQLSRPHAAQARSDLDAAIAACAPLLVDPGLVDIEAVDALVNTARGGHMECEVELGTRAPDEALARLLDGLDCVVDVEALPPGAMLESWGWWSVFGANIARRHLSGEAQQRFLGIFTNKTLEIAEHTGSWSLRERGFAMDHARRAGVPGEERSTPPLLDQEEIRAIVGTMGRFAQFRDAGWQLLRSAVVVE